MTDLFGSLDDGRRQRLRDRGWHEAAGKLHGLPCWRRPDGAIVDETEAFAQLARLEAEERAAQVHQQDRED